MLSEETEGGESYTHADSFLTRWQSITYCYCTWQVSLWLLRDSVFQRHIPNQVMAFAVAGRREEGDGGREREEGDGGRERERDGGGERARRMKREN